MHPPGSDTSSIFIFHLHSVSTATLHGGRKQECFFAFWRAVTIWRSVFRSKIRFGDAEEVSKKTAMSMIIEGLRDEASQAAMDVGTEELMKDIGFQKLAHAMYKIVYLQIRNEARELQRLGCKRNRPLSRQAAEGMINLFVEGQGRGTFSKNLTTK